MVVASIAQLGARVLEWVADGLWRLAAVFDPPAPIVAVAVLVGEAVAPSSLFELQRCTHKFGPLQQ